MKEFFELYFLFFKIGLFTFGGGYAMLPMIQRELVEKKGYATNEEIIDYYAIGQLTPGVIAVNVSTFIGMKRKGLLGAVFSTLGMITPSIIIISLCALVLNSISSNIYVKYAFSGIRTAVCALVIKAVIPVTKRGVRDMFTAILFAAAFILPAFFSVPSVYVILICAVSALIFKQIKKEAE